MRPARWIAVARREFPQNRGNGGYRVGIAIAFVGGIMAACTTDDARPTTQASASSSSHPTAPTASQDAAKSSQSPVSGAEWNFSTRVRAVRAGRAPSGKADGTVWIGSVARNGANALVAEWDLSQNKRLRALAVPGVVRHRKFIGSDDMRYATDLQFATSDTHVVVALSGGWAWPVEGGGGGTLYVSTGTKFRAVSAFGYAASVEISARHAYVLSNSSQIETAKDHVRRTITSVDLGSLKVVSDYSFESLSFRPPIVCVSDAVYVAVPKPYRRVGEWSLVKLDLEDITKVLASRAFSSAVPRRIHCDVGLLFTEASEPGSGPVLRRHSPDLKIEKRWVWKQAVVWEPTLKLAFGPPTKTRTGQIWASGKQTALPEMAACGKQFKGSRADEWSEALWINQRPLVFGATKTGSMLCWGNRVKP